MVIVNKEAKMNKAALFVLILGFSGVFCDVAEDNSTLELVHVFFRHGSRTPDAHEVYPNDPYSNSFYPTGYGQLTNDGKQKAFRLGKLLRARYNDFLGENYTPDLVRTKTTDVDRTKMSALLVLAGLFPPPPNQMWEDNLNWMPIPYHYDTKNNDYDLRRPNDYCPRYMRELTSVLNSDATKRFLKEHSLTFQYVSKHSGRPVNTLMDMFHMFQVLHSEENLNMTLPKWTKNVYPETIRYLAAQQCMLENSTPLLKRLNGGRMLKKVIENMINKSEGLLNPSGRKVYLYSGHDNNVINILAALNLYEPHFPNYSSAVIIELHRENTTNKYYVKVLYVGDVANEPEEQQFPKCGTFCSLDEFLSIADPHLPRNYTLECQSSVMLD